MTQTINVEFSTVGWKIKELYEAEPDTNAFTDSDQSKFLNLNNNIETRISNNLTESNLTSILNKSSFNLENVDNFQQVRVEDLSTKIEAENGSDNTKWMSPLRTREFVEFYVENNNIGGGGGGTASSSSIQNIWLYSGV